MQIKGKLSIKRRETKNISFLVSKRELIRLGVKKREMKRRKEEEEEEEEEEEAKKRYGSLVFV